MLLPTDEDTAMSPKPFLATMTLVIRSGMEVPAAKNVKPITYKIYGFIEYWISDITKFHFWVSSNFENFVLNGC